MNDEELKFELKKVFIVFGYKVNIYDGDSFIVTKYNRFARIEMDWDSDGIPTNARFNLTGTTLEEDEDFERLRNEVEESVLLIKKVNHILSLKE